MKDLQTIVEEAIDRNVNEKKRNYEHTSRGLSFSVALQLLKNIEQTFIRRLIWSDGIYVAFVIDRSTGVLKISDRGIVREYIPTQEDLLRNDWACYVEDDITEYERIINY